MAMNMDSEQQLAALVATVSALKDEVHGLRQEIQRNNDQYLPRAEFTAWRTGLDREVAGIKAARAPWWQVVGGLAGIVAIVLGAIAFVTTVK